MLQFVKKTITTGKLATGFGGKKMQLHLAEFIVTSKAVATRKVHMRWYCKKASFRLIPIYKRLISMTTTVARLCSGHAS